MRKYLFLSQIGITIWRPHPIKHPFMRGLMDKEMDKANVWIVPDKIIKISTLCLIIIPILKPLSDQANKILTGMLGVLELNLMNQMKAYIYSKKNHLNNMDWQKVDHDILQWQPTAILQLDLTAPKLTAANYVAQTYHPEHLVLNQQDKAAAFATLLSLKKYLHQFTS